MIYHTFLLTSEIKSIEIGNYLKCYTNGFSITLKETELVAPKQAQHIIDSYHPRGGDFKV